jgi:hypothetical protein
VAVVLGSALLTAPATTQVVDFDDPVRTYLRLLQISGRSVAGSYTVLPVERPLRALGAEHPWSERLVRCECPTMLPTLPPPATGPVTQTPLIVVPRPAIPTTAPISDAPPLLSDIVSPERPRF